MDIYSLRAKLAFSNYECPRPESSPFEISDRVVVRVHPTKSGSAFGQMTEPAIVGGYVDTIDGVKVLVMYIDREDLYGEFDYELVLLRQVRHLPPVPVFKDAFDAWNNGVDIRSQYEIR